MKPEDLILLVSSIKELINIYNNLEPLLYADFLTALNTTAKSSNVNTNLRVMNRFGLLSRYSLRSWKTRYRVGANWFFTSSAFGVRGGFVTAFLYKRRVRKIFKVILSICNLYLIHPTDSEDTNLANKIIEEIRKKEKNMGKIRDESIEKISEVVKHLSIFLGIPIIASVLWEKIVPTFSSVTFPKIVSDYEGFIIFYTILVSIELFAYWFLPKIRWYRTLMNLYKVRNKEIEVYDSLIPIERIVLDRCFPKIKGVLDVSYETHSNKNS